MALRLLRRITTLLRPEAASTLNGGVMSKSRNVAKDRLSVILAHQRGSDALVGVDMNRLQRDVLQCIKKHIDVDDDTPVNFHIKKEVDLDLFEIQVALSKHDHHEQPMPSPST